MEVLIYIILGSIFGVSVGNTNIRNKIGEEIRTILTQKHGKEVVKDCPIKKVKYKATYTPPKGQTVEKTNTGGCNKCGGHVEPIDKMPGYFYCDKCQSITSKKKDGVK